MKLIKTNDFSQILEKHSRWEEPAFFPHDLSILLLTSLQRDLKEEIQAHQDLTRDPTIFKVDQISSKDLHD